MMESVDLHDASIRATGDGARSVTAGDDGLGYVTVHRRRGPLSIRPRGDVHRTDA